MLKVLKVNDIVNDTKVNKKSHRKPKINEI